MSKIQRLLLLLVAVAGIVAIVYAALDRPSKVDPPASTTNPTTETPAHPLHELAEHHCSKLTPESLATSCLEQVDKDIQTGQLEPTILEVNPLACNGLTDKNKQHECHGWMGHDFAVSTGDISRCEVIPQDKIKASCKETITVNEIKKLYALERADGDEQP